MKWIGLTGGIGCGKSTVLKMFQSENVAVLSADQIVHNLLDNNPEIKAEIKSVFGPSVLEKEQINKSKLAEVIFSNPVKKQGLEDILHPEVKKKALEFKEKSLKDNKKIAIYEIPLLFETNQESFFDFIICVSSDAKTQKERLFKRGWSEDMINKRLKSQKPLEYKENNSDFVIFNNKSLEDLEGSVLEVLRKLI